MKRRKIDSDTKIAAVLEGLKGESSIADLSCSSGSHNRDVSHYGINPSQWFFQVITDCSEHQHQGKCTPVLRKGLENGGKLVFTRGVLEVGDKKYHFQDGACIVSLGQGQFTGWGISFQPLKEGSEPERKVEKLKKIPQVVEPVDEDE